MMSRDRNRSTPRRATAKSGRGGQSGAAARPPVPTTDHAVAERSTSAARRAIRGRASVLVAGLRGFNQLVATAEPSSVVRLLDEFFASMTDVAVGHRALIDRPVNEELMLVYGLPRSRRDDGMRGIRSALDMQSTFLSLRNRWLSSGREDVEQLCLSIGVATGLVVFAGVDFPPGRGRTPVGEVVDRAARLCQAAAPAECLIDEVTYAAGASGLDKEAIFTSREVALRPRESVSGYRVQRRRAALCLVRARLQRDPVCKVALDPATATRRWIAGQMMYFCSDVCAERFVADPAAFAI